MKKIVNIVCGIFIFCLTFENIGFVYAQSENQEDPTVNEVIEINPAEVTNQVEIQQGEVLNSSPTPAQISEPEVKQVTQTIDTSSYGIIRIKDPNNPGKGITIHDRNLGANATGAGVDETRNSFGYYFQWGNNYGFPSDPNATISRTGTRVDSCEYGPNTENGYYSSDTFIFGNSDRSSVRNDNLRGGSGDRYNNRGYPMDNAIDRRGPCPENYHIPSIGEWNKLLEFWAKEYNELSLEMDNGFYKFEGNTNAVNAFNLRFFIPLAGGYTKNGIIDYTNIWNLLLTSSPINSSDAFSVYGRSNGISLRHWDFRASAYPIRCFFNSDRLPIKITYDTNGGYWVDEEVKFSQKIITYTKKDDNSEYSGNIPLGTIKRNDTCGADGNKKCAFAGWYTLTSDEMRTGNISEDITLYAKWLEYDMKDISYSGINFIIMDRNLGAEASGTDENAYGYYITGGENDIMCPEGYHIPSSGEWLGIKNLLSEDFNSGLVKDLLNLPFAGKILDNEAIETGENAYYLAKNGDEIMYAKISDSDIEIKNLENGERVSARCFKDYNTGTIKFHPNGGDEISDIIAVNRREDGQSLEDATRDNSNFLGWYTTSDFQEGSNLERNINYKNEEEINLYAKWVCNEGYKEKKNVCEKIEKKSGGSSGGGGGGRGSSKDVISNPDSRDKKSTGLQTGNKVDSIILSQNDNKSSSGAIAYPAKLDNEPINVTTVDSSTSSRNDNIKYPQEFIDAYNFAYKNGITSKPSIEDAKIFSPLTRIQMAKMLSNYAINVLGKKPDISKGTIKFEDVSNKLNKEYDNAVTLVYQLGIMGQNIKNYKFRPYDEVSRAEFSTALSRLLYGTKDGENNYFEPHIKKLYDEGFINKGDPSSIEKRGYVMIIFSRIL